MRYRYYCLDLPPMPGTVPNGAVGMEEFDEPTYCPQIEKTASGYVDYERPLTRSQLEHYWLDGPEVRP